VAKFEERSSKKCYHPPFPQKLFTFVKQFIMEFKEFSLNSRKIENTDNLLLNDNLIIKENYIMLKGALMEH